MTGLVIALALIAGGALLTMGAFACGLTMTRDGRDSCAVLWAFGTGLAGMCLGIALLILKGAMWLVGAG